MKILMNLMLWVFGAISVSMVLAAFVVHVMNGGGL